MTSGTRVVVVSLPVWLCSVHRSAALHLGKIEKGDPGVAMGHYSTVLFVIGMDDRLGDLAGPRNDNVGLQPEEERLPQRIRNKRKN
jgi:hypothetical protein